MQTEGLATEKAKTGEGKRVHSTDRDEVAIGWGTRNSGSVLFLAPANFLDTQARDRQILWLAHAEGYTHPEIAQITGLASASIRLLLFRARRKIARLLTEFSHPGAEGSRRL